MTTPLPIQPRPPIRGGLASVSAQLPLPESEWRGGVWVTPETNMTTFRWGCATTGDKPTTTLPEASLFEPATVGAMMECGPNGGVQPMLEAYALEMWKRQRWSEAAKLLHDGTTDGPEAGQNFSLKDATAAPGFDPAAPGSIEGTLQGLLDIVCNCSSSDPVLHVPRAFMSQFMTQTLIRWDEPTGTFRFGPHLVSFDCYPNLGPDAVEGGANPTPIDGSQVWIWATSQPLVEWSAQERVRTVAPRRNEHLLRVEQDVIVTIDPGCAYGARALVDCP